MLIRHNCSAIISEGGL